MGKESTGLHKYLTVIIFAIIFAVSVILYCLWYDEKQLFRFNVYATIAKCYLQPIILISGISILLYILELFKIVKIKRSQTLSIVLLIIISLLIIWQGFIAGIVCGLIRGEGAQNFISILPQFMTLGIYKIYYFTFWGMLIYEILGIGLFVAIGSRELNYKDINYD